MPDVRIDIPTLDEQKESLNIRLSGKKIDIDKARKLFDEHIAQLNISIENSIEQYITIDSKWHNRFFQNKRKLLNELQQQDGDMLIKLPERNTNSDQVLLRGPKQVVERVQKRLEELINTWENTITKEISIPHRHYGYLLAQGGSYIQPIQKEYNVQIKFPPRNNEQDSSNDDRVRITGRSDDIEKAIIALEKMIPTETTLDIPYEAHGSLVGKDGSQLETLMEQYPDVQITFPPLNSTSNIIYLKGQTDQVEGLKKDLFQYYEKYQIDKQARSYELRFTIKPEYRSLITGYRRRTINHLKQKYDVNIQISNSQTPPSAVVPTPSTGNDTTQQHDDQQAIPQENHSLSTESTSHDVEILITGYENQALTCRDEILKLIQEFESTITMEIDIDHRIHARIIGTGGQKLQQIMKEYDVEIKFPTNNNQSDKVHVIGTNQEKIDTCIDHLLILEEDYLQDISFKQQTNLPIQGESTFGQQLANAQHQNRQQEVPSSNNGVGSKATAAKNNNNKQARQAPFKVKNAPWTPTEQNGFDNEQKRMNNGHKKSPRKGSNAPNKDDLGKILDLDFLISEPISHLL